MSRDFAQAFYHSKIWKETREYILKRDHYICCRCYAPATDVHHKIRLTPKNIHDPAIALGEDNLESLCDYCHKREHDKDRRAEIFFLSYEFDDDGNPIPPGR